MSEPQEPDARLDDVIDPTETARPDHREHAKTPHPVDEDELEERTEHERRAVEADRRAGGT